MHKDDHNTLSLIHSQFMFKALKIEKAEMANRNTCKNKYANIYRMHSFLLWMNALFLKNQLSLHMNHSRTVMQVLTFTS